MMQHVARNQQTVAAFTKRDAVAEAIDLEAQVILKRRVQKKMLAVKT